MCTFWGCTGKNDSKKLFIKGKVDVRLGSAFCSVRILSDNTGFGLKGRLVSSTGEFVILSSDTSEVVKFQAADIFFNSLEKLHAKPITNSGSADGPRVEIYYLNKKVYDSQRWDEDFWDLIRPIICSPPKGFKPFSPEGSPFS